LKAKSECHEKKNKLVYGTDNRVVVPFRPCFLCPGYYVPVILPIIEPTTVFCRIVAIWKSHAEYYSASLAQRYVSWLIPLLEDDTHTNNHSFLSARLGLGLEFVLIFDRRRAGGWCCHSDCPSKGPLIVEQKNFLYIPAGSWFCVLLLLMLLLLLYFYLHCLLATVWYRRFVQSILFGSVRFDAIYYTGPDRTDDEWIFTILAGSWWCY